MSQSSVFSRLWLWSRNCSPISAVTLLVNNPFPPTVVDSKSGRQFYSVQLQAVNLEGLFMQHLVQFQPTVTIWQVGFGEITATTGFSLEKFPIRYPFSLGMSFAADGKMLASFTQLNTKLNNVGGPYMKELSVKVTSKGMRHVNFIAGGYGGGSSATFQKGAVFDFGLSVQGIADLKGDGTNLVLGKGVPVICGTSSFPQTAETGNILYRLERLEPAKALVHAYVP